VDSVGHNKFDIKNWLFGAGSSISPLVVICSILFCSSAFAQDQYFTDESCWRLPDTNVWSSGADIGDIDGDGDLDICIGHNWVYMAPLYLLVNDGSGVFTYETVGRLPLAYDFQAACTFGDIDNDRDLDLYVATNGPGGSVRIDYLYINNGIGVFEDQTAWRLPDIELATGGALLADFNENFYLDIVVHAAFGPYPRDRLYINDTQGIFQDESLTRLPPDVGHNRYIMTLDIDNDLDLDIIESYSDASFYGARLLKNLGQGYFTDQCQDQFYSDYVTNFEPGDIDLDGDLDFITFTSGDINIWINNNEGFYEDETFLRLPYTYDPSLVGSLALGDYDNDGDLDLFVGRTSMSLAHLMLNDGQGYFILANNRLPDSTQSAYWIEKLDADGDGDLDIFMPCQGDGRQKLYINHSRPDTIPPNILAETKYSGFLDSAAYYPLRISAWDNISMALGEFSGRLVYSVNGAGLTTLPLLHLGGTIFGERLPGQAPGSIIDYYYEMIDRMGNRTYVPSSAPDSVYSFEVAPSTDIGSPGITPSDFKFEAYPNPFNSSINFNISGLKGGEAEISIYNIMGELVKTLKAKEGKTNWDAVDNAGRSVPSGVYFARVKTPQTVKVKKVMYLR
jgi:hypothetical protein